MKRNSMGVPVRTAPRWTPTPVSCQLCRTKKLRCDRTQPCSNCISRKVICAYAGREPEALSTISPSPRTSQSLGQHSNHDVAEILQRLKKLEDAFYGNSSSSATDGEMPFLSSTLSLQTLRSGDNLAYSDPAVEVVDQNNASNWLEGIATTPNSEMTLNNRNELSERNDACIQFRLSPSFYPSSTSFRPTGSLPTKEGAKELFNNFVKRVDHYRTVHVPSGRSLLERTYERIAYGYEPDTSTLAFLFSIFASSTFYWTEDLGKRLRVSTSGAKNAHHRFSKTAVYLLENDNRPSITLLQSLCIMTHLLANSDGLSSTVELVRSKALWMARSMRIHQLDAPRNRQERQLKPVNPIDLEVQRRLWWHLVGSDWLVAFSGGPREGTYTINHKQMNVKFPSNVDDENIAGFEEDYNLPLSMPTETSVFLQRTNLAHICREIVDSMSSIFHEGREDLDYDTVIGLSAKFQKLLDELPPFFRLDAASIRQSEPICKERPYIALQRTMLHFSVHIRISRLHKPFLLQGTSNPKYAFSRMTCIRSAQTVLELRRSMDEPSTNPKWHFPRFSIVSKHLFMATIILAMDLCFTQNEPHVERRKAEVLDACKMLEKTQEESTVAIKGIQNGVKALRTLLQKRRPSSRSLNISKVPAVHSDHNLTSVTENEDDISYRAAVAQPTMPQGTWNGSEPFLSFTSNEASEFGPWDGENWDQLWSDFFDVAPTLDIPDCNSLLMDMDLDSLGAW